MKRHVLIVPLDAILRHLETNIRQDVKVVVPSMLTDELYKLLIKKGKQLKPEVALDGDIWKRSYKTEPNMLCESADFAYNISDKTKGPFAISFANDKAEQEKHYHKLHTEIYFSEHRMSGYYQAIDGKDSGHFDLEHGGLVLFQPNILHYMELSGITLILETPSLDDDRFIKGEA
jgi:hypothetical protein